MVLISIINLFVGWNMDKKCSSSLPIKMPIATLSFLFCFVFGRNISQTNFFLLSFLILYFFLFFYFSPCSTVYFFCFIQMFLGTSKFPSTSNSFVTKTNFLLQKIKLRTQHPPPFQHFNRQRQKNFFLKHNIY